ncbi:alcohol dehydrogenase/S-(hydroxymethyl)glutathione dehydrogenase/alcohol dehydrogenase [Nocardia tenerifensis]|uniref:Alcohol dehydrogenase/S-(Hydroxymethyl)glutathione dehydrogenase/alcohol dehydrogenase n=1 Tax=Nocardia tenerifensis TaxID=228006 RepID=A0A318KHN0_9NOCA|nr:Zn-dependent alcohol dehydrogenase [Nocardia tenerifensis]PXX71673.1 alcohol dehydrogenase/S-(hydroxymethyl)glutathione dehydrogenase/alcohol dehydrogenase [Nocardia tenerifensis]
MITTEAAILTALNEPLEFTEIQVDDPEPGEVRVAVSNVGLCHSDLHYMTGTVHTDLPVVVGHEVAGVVESVGSAVTSLRPGDRVVGALTPSCGLCRNCQVGQPTQCRRVAQIRQRPRAAFQLPDGQVVDRLGDIGAFSRHTLMRENALVKLPDKVGLQVGCLLSCCVITGIGAVFRGARVRPGATVAVIGCGGVGSAVIQGARLAGASAIVAVDLDEARLAAARTYGATHVVHGAADVATEIADLLGDGVDYAFEAVGSARTAATALSVVRAAGTACLVGIAPDGTELSLPAADFFFGEKRLIGSYMGSGQAREDIAQFARLYLQGRLLLDEMVSDVIPFRAIDKGFEAMKSGRVTRIVADLTV